jgi:hypothetical protein
MTDRQTPEAEARAIEVPEAAGGCSLEGISRHRTIPACRAGRTGNFAAPEQARWHRLHLVRLIKPPNPAAFEFCENGARPRCGT